MRSASRASSLDNVGFIDHPTTILERRSITTAR
jgi:hypothetical protein